MDLIGELVLQIFGGIFGRLKQGDWVMALLIVLVCAIGALLAIWFVMR